MVSPSGIAVTVLGFAIVLGAAGVVYRDAIRVGISRPLAWAAFVFVTCGAGLGSYRSPLDVPVPGLLVVVLAGPALYLFERDDAKHGDEPADPRSLPDGPGDAGGERSDEQ
jgi:hypothetical protein